MRLKILLRSGQEIVTDGVAGFEIDNSKITGELHRLHWTTTNNGWLERLLYVDVREVLAVTIERTPSERARDNVERSGSGDDTLDDIVRTRGKLKIEEG